MAKSPGLFLCGGLLASGCFNPTGEEFTTDASSSGPATTTGMATTDGGPVEDSTSVDPPGTTDTTVDPPVDSSGSDTTGPPGEPEIEVRIEDTPVEAGESFGVPMPVDVGGMIGPVTVTVENTGTADLQITGVLPSGDTNHFVIDQDRLASTLEAGASSTFTVAFAPTNGGLKEVTLSIGNDDADEAPFDFTVSGHTTPNVYRPIMTAGSPPPRFNSAMEWMDDGRLLLFGGRGPGGGGGMPQNLDDTWIFDPEAEEWSQVMTPVAPSPRFAHAMASAGDNTVVLFGGTDSGNGPALPGVTWIFDGDAQTWMPVMTPGPVGRFQHAMVELDGPEVLLFGGRTDSGGSELNDTWRFDGMSQMWTNLGPGGAPSPRSAFAMAYDGSDSVVVYGGIVDFGTLFDETWVYSVAANTWMLADPGMGPGQRFSLSGEFLLDGRMTVFSGKLDSCCVDPSPGTFAYDPAMDAWANETPMMEPTPRFNYAMTSRAEDDKIILFGGVLQNTGFGTAQGDTWEYVGAQPPG